jgi:hypothetical protein
LRESVTLTCPDATQGEDATIIYARKWLIEVAPWRAESTPAMVHDGRDVRDDALSHRADF